MKTVILEDSAATEAIEAMVTGLHGKPSAIRLNGYRACVTGRRMIAAERDDPTRRELQDFEAA